jgi:hypothetical protein
MKRLENNKLGRELAGKNDTEFSSCVTPDIGGGRRSLPHPVRFPRREEKREP